VQQRTWFVAVAVLFSISLSACALGPTPQWEKLYSEHLNQTVLELDRSTINEEYLNPASGALTRAAWARVRGGDTILLGLPPHGLDPDEVVQRTVVLNEDEWRSACGQALGVDEVWGWEMNHAHPENSIQFHINNDRDTYCEFFFLPEGWELRTVQSHGILKPFHQP